MSPTPFRLTGEWIHLAPLGDHPHEQVTQRLSADSVAALVERHESDGRPHLLLDYEHESHDAASRTEAAGWITELQARADGLWGRVRWTDAGAAAVQGGRYRYISPVWEVREAGAGVVVPVRLLDAAVTNRPNLRGLQPLSNRLSGGHSAQQHTMKTVLKLLGLSEDASEQSAAEAVQALLAKVKESAAAAAPLTNRVAELTRERDDLLAAQVDADLERFSSVIANKDEVRAQLLANRQGTLKLLGALQAPADKSGSLTNRARAAQPAGAIGKTESKSVLRNRLIAGKRTGSTTYEQAYKAAKAERPELFTDEES